MDYEREARRALAAAAEPEMTAVEKAKINAQLGIGYAVLNVSYLLASIDDALRNTIGGMPSRR
jgi:hypothetical protein